MRAHTPPRPHHPHRPHPPWPAFPRHYTDLARISYMFKEYLKAANACPHPPALSPPPPPAPHLARISSPLPRLGSHFLGEKVFKGCQCVLTPPRALTTPTAHTPPHPASPPPPSTPHRPPRHYPHLVAFFECLESIQRLPMRAHAPPRPHHPHRPHPPWPAFPRHYTDLARIS